MTKRDRKKRLRKLALESLESRQLMAGLPFGADQEDTGEFMLGRIAVTPVLLESDGSIDRNSEDWTPTLINNVLNNIQTGLNWWTQLLATKSTVHTLDWIVDTSFATNPRSTPYEPINRTSDASTLWINKFLADIGYSDVSGLQTNLRAFNNAQRTKLNTDWSFTIFVVNSTNDGDGSFAPGGSFARAFSFAGGLYEVVPSSRPASTFAHETGHIFWARDEYTGGGTYFQKRGYYNSQNLNAIDANPTPNFQQAPSIMSSGSALQTAFDTITNSDATLAQIGWQDSDHDGIFDVLDVPLKLEGTGRFDPLSSNYRFVGRASVQTLPNRNSSGSQNDITLNRIGRVEYRINGGSWISVATPDSYTANLDLTIPLLSSSGQIEIRAIDPRIGVTSNIFLGAIGDQPDITTQAGIQGFVWGDTNNNSSWASTEKGLAGIPVSLVNASNQPISLQTMVEPDNFRTGMFNDSIPGLRLDVIGDDASGTLGIFEDSTPSTGTKIFKPFSLSVGSYLDAFKGTSQQLRARFDNPTSYVSIDAISIADNTDVRLDAYAADGSLIKRFERKGLLNGQVITMEVGTDVAQIASVIAHGTNGSYVKLDNLRVGPKTSTTTASDGSFVLPYLPAGAYRVLAQPAGVGFHITNPASGVQIVSLDAGGIASHVDFGVYRDPSPWQNPRIHEDVDNSSEVGPLDVLVLVNEINLRQARPLDGSGLPSPPYYDVDGDRNLSPLDVLMVINYINSKASGGLGGAEGEVPQTSLVGTEKTSADAPMPSFVIDAQRNQPNTWIVSSSARRAMRPEAEAERCGCPACMSVQPAGQTSPAITDIASARNSAPKAVAQNTKTGEASKVDSALQDQSLGRLDLFLADWTV